MFRQGLKSVIGRVRGCPNRSLLTHILCCLNSQKASKDMRLMKNTSLRLSGFVITAGS